MRFVKNVSISDTVLAEHLAHGGMNRRRGRRDKELEEVPV